MLPFPLLIWSVRSSKREHLIELAWFLIHGLVGDPEMFVLLTTVPTICMPTPDDEAAP